MRLFLIVLLLSGCASTWNAVTRPVECGTEFQRASFAQAEPCAKALRAEHVRRGISPKLGTYARFEHYLVTRQDYPPIMTEADKAELVRLQNLDVDLCMEYRPSAKGSFSSPDEVGQVVVTEAQVVISHVQTPPLPPKPASCGN